MQTSNILRNFSFPTTSTPEPWFYECRSNRRVDTEAKIDTLLYEFRDGGDNEKLFKAVRKILRHDIFGAYHRKVNQNIGNHLCQAGYRAVHWAAKNGNHEAIVMMACVPGFDPNVKNYGGYTPLHTAISQLYDRPELLARTVRVLLQVGANANQMNDGGYLPLQYAIWYCRASGAPTYSALALGVGTNRSLLNWSDASGMTPDAYATYYGFSLRELLMQYHQMDGTPDDIHELSRDVIQPFRSASLLEGDELIQARNNFCEYMIEPSYPNLAEVFQCSYEEEKISEEQLGCLALLLRVDEEDSDCLDEHYITLADDALEQYWEADSYEARCRAMDDYWCYSSGLVPVEVVRTEGRRVMRQGQEPLSTCEIVTGVVQNVVTGATPILLACGPVGQAIAGIARGGLLVYNNVNIIRRFLGI